MTNQVKTVWLTGASAGIGEALAKMMAQNGWQVYATARDKGALEALSGQVDGIIPMPGDVTDAQAMQAMAERIGHIDLAVFNAGYYKPDPIADFTYAEFEKHVQVNLLGVGACVAACMPAMRAQGQGHIAITASVAGYHGLPKSLSYGPTKAALINFAESLAVEARGTGVKVQVINPGFVKTRLTDQNTFPMPFLMDTEQAAAHIMRGLDKGGFEIAFPWLFGRILRLIAGLPYALSIPLVAKTKAD